MDTSPLLFIFQNEISDSSIDISVIFGTQFFSFSIWVYEDAFIVSTYLNESYHSLLQINYSDLQKNNLKSKPNILKNYIKALADEFTDFLAVKLMSNEKIIDYYNFPLTIKEKFEDLDDIYLSQ